MFVKIKDVYQFLDQLEGKTDKGFSRIFALHIKDEDCSIFEETLPSVTTIVIVLNDYHMCHIFKYYEHTFEKITITIPEIHVLSGLLKKEGW